jgi:hypothetical protein
MHDLRDEIETHPALLELLAAVVRENGYSVQYNLKWGFQWVHVKQDCIVAEPTTRAHSLLVAPSQVFSKSL